MCARYSLVPDEFRQIRIEFQLDELFEYPARYNIAPSYSPGHEVPIFVSKGPGARRVLPARFWMIPSHWKRKLSQLPSAFNARSEGIAQRPFWAKSFESRRCLVPATGWREFAGQSGAKQAFQFHHGGPFAFAGIWDCWRDPSRPGAPEVVSFAILTGPASEVVRPIHPRMPLRVHPQFYGEWLDPGVSGSQALDRVLGEPFDPPQVYQADPRGNDSRLEGVECIAPYRRKQLSLFD